MELTIFYYNHVPNNYQTVGRFCDIEMIFKRRQVLQMFNLVHKKRDSGWPKGGHPNSDTVLPICNITDGNFR